MFGPAILVRSLSVPSTVDEFGNAWQYHSRSDRHSKIACWGLLFDLIATCPLLRSQIARRAVGFGINHRMFDFKTGRKKDLDLVICTPGTATEGKDEAASFTDLAAQYGTVLARPESAALGDLPGLKQVAVGSVHLALEAKACMTAHIKALPRLYDELNSSHLAIHGSSDFSIAAGFAMVNFSETFLSSDKNKFDMKRMDPRVSVHKQPKDATRAVEKIREIPRRTQTGTEGFDALGIVGVNCKNDGSPVTLVSTPPAPPANDIFHYDSLVRRIAHLYESKFANV